MNEDEDFTITSKIPGSQFSATTVYNNKMAVFSTLRALQYYPKTLATSSQSSSTPTTDTPVPEPPTPPTTTTTITTTTTSETALTTRHPNSQIMHDRLFHPSAERMRQLGIKHLPKTCDYCILGKQTRTPFSKVTISDMTPVPLLRVYSDLCGIINPISFGNAKYVLTFLDQATQYSWIYFIPNKLSNTILAIFKRWLAMVERQFNRKLQFLHTDGGKEYTGESANKTFTTFLKDFSIQHDTTPAYSSSSNGAAE